MMEERIRTQGDGVCLPPPGGVNPLGLDAEEDARWLAYRLPFGHEVMISAPRELADVLSRLTL